ncbi:hypothetical protein [Paraburkholderia sp. GAS38]|uniref:hypothetical protein n=1 Tax=Paraburkholderia sp. GAS38 TaxID=3035133 RepID=UPI003D23E94B
MTGSGLDLNVFVIGEMARILSPGLNGSIAGLAPDSKGLTAIFISRVTTETLKDRVMWHLKVIKSCLTSGTLCLAAHPARAALFVNGGRRNN